jgi:hypothetical protein
LRAASFLPSRLFASSSPALGIDLVKLRLLQLLPQKIVLLNFPEHVVVGKFGLPFGVLCRLECPVEIVLHGKQACLTSLCVGLGLLELILGALGALTCLVALVLGSAEMILLILARQ